MESVPISQAKNHLSRLLRQVAKGEEVVITRGKLPIAKLVPIAPAIPLVRRQPGRLRGKIQIAADFDDPLPADWTAALGSDDPGDDPEKDPG